MHTTRIYPILVYRFPPLLLAHTTQPKQAERAAQQQQQQQRPSWREGLARAKEQSRCIGDAYSREERGGDVWRAGNGSATGTAAAGRSAHVEQLLAQLRQERAQGKKLRDGGGVGPGAGGVGGGDNNRRRRSLPTSDARASSAVTASVEPPSRPPRSASTPRSLPREDAEQARASSAALPPAGGGGSFAQGKRSPGLSQAEYERLRRRNKEWQEDLQRRRDRCGSRGGAGGAGAAGGGIEAGGGAAEAIASRYATGERGTPWMPDLAPSKSSGSTAPTEAQSQLGDTTGGMWKVCVCV